MQTVTSNITILDVPQVDLLDYMGSDSEICDAARVSTNTFDRKSAEVDQKLINYLLKNKHGTPFEHAAMKFYVSAPIFTFREFHRHRIGFSYNEMSGRYTELPSEFYIPGKDRPLMNYGSSAHPDYRAPQTQAEIDLHNLMYAVMHDDVMDSYVFVWGKYKHMLENGIAKEVARIVLPVGIYSRMYVTCNPRSLMNFLSLRIEDKDAAHVSHPQYEIQQVAKKMEFEFMRSFPMTYKAYVDNGRVAP